MRNLPAGNKQAGYSINNIASVPPHSWGPGNNFSYQHDCRCMTNLLEDNRQADHPINNSVSFQEGRTAQDTCTNRCKVLDIARVLSLYHVLRIKKEEKFTSKIEENESTGNIVTSVSVC